MLQYMPYVWVAITLFAAYLESNTADLITIWFIPAGCVAFILSVIPFKISIGIQVLVFFAIATVLIIFSTRFFRKSLKKRPLIPTNLDAVIGKDAIVTENIDNISGKGAVKVLGKEWSALMDDPSSTATVDEIVTVKEIRGVKLVCSKK